MQVNMGIQRGQSIVGDKYQIVDLIGEGGMARVWLAEEPRFANRPVAIKEPRADLLPELVEEIRLRYQREVQVCAALDRSRVPHIVRAITTELHEDSLLLVMEYMPGGDLESLLEKQPDGLPLDRALSITRDLLAALEGVHAHQLDIVHRDVKPSNVLFDRVPAEGAPVQAHLADFGLAQLPGVSGRSHLKGGQHPGTPMYMAPEQEKWSRPLMPAADLYALGCMLFEMLTAQRYKRHRPGTKASALRPEVPGWLDQVLARALADDPWDRYQAAAEMAAALEKGEAAEQARAAEEARKRKAAEEQARAAEEERKRKEAEEQARRAEEERSRREVEEKALREEQERARRAEEERSRRETEQRKRRHAAAWVWREPDDRAERETVPQARRGTRARVPRWAWAVAAVMVLAAVVGLGVALGGGGRSTPTLPPMDGVRTRQKDGMQMVHVPAGDFFMGSTDSDAQDDEKPRLAVTLAAFWIDRTEVSNAQYRRCVEDGVCQAPVTCSGGEPTYGDDAMREHPVVCVDWNDARTYCEWAGARLPTEAEWEKAARGTDGWEYPWGDTFDGSRVNFCDRNCEEDWKDTDADDGYARTAPVGSYPEGTSPYGVLDMAGNVWEWVADWYDADYYSGSPPRDPQGPGTGEHKVLRGGSWLNRMTYVRSAYRYWLSPSNAHSRVGFRCAADEPSSATPSLPTSTHTPRPTDTPTPSATSLIVPSAEDAERIQVLVEEGRVQMDAKQWEEAEETFLQVLELDPNHPQAHSALAYIYAKQGRVDEAIAENLTVIRLVPNDYNSYKNLGLLYEQEGNITEAIAAIEQALALAPDQERANLQAYLEQLKQQQGQLSPTVAPEQRAGDLSPQERNGMYAAPPPITIDPSKSYRATIATPKGNIVVDLAVADAPQTVNNFVYLSRAGFYDGLSFHRVENSPGFSLIQGGDPTGTGGGGPGYTVPAEIGLPHDAGAIATARTADQVNPERASSGSQFYVCLEPIHQLDSGYTVFGYVVEGLDVARGIAAGDQILTIVISEH